MAKRRKEEIVTPENMDPAANSTKPASRPFIYPRAILEFCPSNGERGFVTVQQLENLERVKAVLNKSERAGKKYVLKPGEHPRGPFLNDPGRIFRVAYLSRIRNVPQFKDVKPDSIYLEILSDDETVLGYILLHRSQLNEVLPLNPANPSSEDPSEDPSISD